MRRAPLVLMAVVLSVAVLAAVGATRSSAPDGEQQAAHAADRITAPVSAQAVDACHGDGVRACWQTAASVSQIADAMSASLTDASGRPATQTCDRVPVGTTGPAFSADACFVRVRFGEHGVFVFVDPITERDRNGVATVLGSRISVQTA